VQRPASSSPSRRSSKSGAHGAAGGTDTRARTVGRVFFASGAAPPGWPESLSPPSAAGPVPTAHRIRFHHRWNGKSGSPRVAPQGKTQVTPRALEQKIRESPWLPRPRRPGPTPTRWNSKSGWIPRPRRPGPAPITPGSRGDGHRAAPFAPGALQPQRPGLVRGAAPPTRGGWPDGALETSLHSARAPGLPQSQTPAETRGHQRSQAPAFSAQTASFVRKREMRRTQV
jgi:hypothetical protein